MKCGDCQHDAPHGRKGFGSCSQKTWTAHGLAEAERINAELTAERKSEAVMIRVLETLFALPGMHERCKCVRRKAARPTLAAASLACRTRHDIGDSCPAIEAARATAPTGKGGAR